MQSDPVNTQVNNFQGNSRMHWETAPQQYSSLASIEQASPIFLGSSLGTWFFILILNCPVSLPCTNACICQCVCILPKTFCDERYYISNGASPDFIFYILSFMLDLCSPALVKPNTMLFLKHHLGQPLTEEYRAPFACQKYLCRIRSAGIYLSKGQDKAALLLPSVR